MWFPDDDLICDVSVWRWMCIGVKVGADVAIATCEPINGVWMRSQLLERGAKPLVWQAIPLSLKMKSICLS